MSTNSSNKKLSQVYEAKRCDGRTKEPGRAELAQLPSASLGAKTIAFLIKAFQKSDQGLEESITRSQWAGGMWTTKP